MYASECGLAFLEAAGLGSTNHGRTLQHSPQNLGRLLHKDCEINFEEVPRILLNLNTLLAHQWPRSMRTRC